jgi:hypothetical protein
MALSRFKKTIMASTMVAAIGIGTAAASVAAGDTDDHFNVAAGTVISGSGSFTGSGTFGGVAITIKCTSITASGKAPSKGLTVTLSAPPVISGCTDTLGGTDTITTSGTWKIAEVDLANDETGTEPNATGDKGKIIIPMDGATFQSSIDPACVVTVAPTASASITGSYNDAGKAVIKNKKVPVSPGASCPSGTGTTGTLSSTLTLSPGVHDVS